MFAYCHNNPTSFSDHAGTASSGPITVTGDAAKEKIGEYAGVVAINATYDVITAVLAYYTFGTAALVPATVGGAIYKEYNNMSSINSLYNLAAASYLYIRDGGFVYTEYYPWKPDKYGMTPSVTSFNRISKEPIRIAGVQSEPIMSMKIEPFTINVKPVTFNYRSPEYDFSALQDLQNLRLNEIFITKKQ